MVNLLSKRTCFLLSPSPNAYCRSLTSITGLTVSSLKVNPGCSRDFDSMLFMSMLPAPGDKLIFPGHNSPLITAPLIQLGRIRLCDLLHGDQPRYGAHDHGEEKDEQHPCRREAHQNAGV